MATQTKSVTTAISGVAVVGRQTKLLSEIHLPQLTPKLKSAQHVCSEHAGLCLVCAGMGPNGPTQSDVVTVWLPR